MPYLFSYGTLQQPAVQLATFGRLLDGHVDELVSFERGLFTVEDPAFVAKSGTAQHQMVRPNGRSDSRVAGIVFEVSDAELEQSDAYEPTGYTRISTVLASGKVAWVYAGASIEGGGR